MGGEGWGSSGLETMHNPSSTLLHLHLVLFFFQFQWLPAGKVGWAKDKKKTEKENSKTAGSKHLTGGCQHPLPVVCRLGSGVLGQPAPSGPFTSGCAEFGWEGALSAMTPFWRKYNVSGKKKEMILLRHRFNVEHEPPEETLKWTKNKERAECRVICCLFFLIFFYCCSGKC